MEKFIDSSTFCGHIYRQLSKIATPTWTRCITGNVKLSIDAWPVDENGNAKPFFDNEWTVTHLDKDYTLCILWHKIKEYNKQTHIHITNRRGILFACDKKFNDIHEIGTSLQHIKTQLGVIGGYAYKEQSLRVNGCSYVNAHGKIKYPTLHTTASATESETDHLKLMWREIVLGCCNDNSDYVHYIETGAGQYFTYCEDTNSLIETDAPLDLDARAIKKRLSEFGRLILRKCSQKENKIHLEIEGFYYRHSNSIDSGVQVYVIESSQQEALKKIWREICILHGVFTYFRRADSKEFHYDADKDDVVEKEPACIYKKKLSVMSDVFKIQQSSASVSVSMPEIGRFVDSREVTTCGIWHYGVTEYDAYKKLWLECSRKIEANYFYKNKTTGNTYVYEPKMDSMVEKIDVKPTNENIDRAFSIPDIVGHGYSSQQKLSVMSSHFIIDQNKKLIMPDINVVRSDGIVYCSRIWHWGGSEKIAFDRLWEECQIRGSREGMQFENTATGKRFEYDSGTNSMVDVTSIIDNLCPPKLWDVAMTMPEKKDPYFYQKKLSVMSSIFRFNFATQRIFMPDICYAHEKSTEKCHKGTLWNYWSGDENESANHILAYRRLWLELIVDSQHGYIFKNTFNNKRYRYDKATDSMLEIT